MKHWVGFSLDPGAKAVHPRPSTLDSVDMETPDMVSTAPSTRSTPLFARAPLTEQVLTHLGALISDGTWAPGSTLPSESELCGTLGVSRAVLRECIRVLSSQGVLAARQGKGTYVLPPSDWNIGETLSLVVRADTTQLLNWLEVRSALETAAACFAATRCTDADGAELRSLLADLDKADTGRSYLEADIAFHLSVAKASHNAQFRRLLKPLLRPLREQLSETADLPHLRHAANLEHASIAAAVTSHDASRAGDLVTSHIMRVASEFALLSRSGTLASSSDRPRDDKSTRAPKRRATSSDKSKK